MAANGKAHQNLEAGVSKNNLLGDGGEKEHENSLYISKQFTFFLFVEAIIVLLFGLFVEYDEATEARETIPSNTQSFGAIYPMFQDIHVMVYIGFGFLMTFLRRYGYSAVGFTFLLGCFAFQWAILCRGFFESLLTNNWHRIPLRVETLVNADFCAASVLISVGAVLGKLSPPQMIVMTFVEVIVYAFNEQIVVGQIRASDIGGSITIHIFGAYFGLAVTKLMSRPKAPSDNDDESSAYHADLFSMIGCVFLFLYWPSFNAALAGSNGNGQHRAVVNTILGITTSVIIVFFFSKILNGKFRMEDIQNATLAGGVALGASANMRTYAWGAMVVGAIAGCVSVIGFSKINPWLKRNNYLRDTCGVNNLHGMPGIIGGLASIVFASMTSTVDYADYLSDGLFSISTRTADQQAGFQMLAIVATLLISIAGGILCSGLLKLTPFSRVRYEFQDSEFWEVPGREVPLYFSAPKTVETSM